MHTCRHWSNASHTKSRAGDKGVSIKSAVEDLYVNKQRCCEDLVAEKFPDESRQDNVLVVRLSLSISAQQNAYVDFLAEPELHSLNGGPWSSGLIAR